MTDGTNTSMTLESLVSEAKKLGGANAAGDDAISMLFLRVVRASWEGIIDLTRDKHGKGVDDTAHIYGAYSAERSRKAIHERNTRSNSAQFSKLRTGVKMGMLGSAGIDPVDVMDRAVVIYAKLMATGIKVKAAYAAYLDVARAQLAAAEDGNGELTDAEITDVVRKGEKAEPDAEKFLQQEMKRWEKALTGEAGFKLDSDQADEIYHAIKSYCGGVLKTSEVAETEQQLAALHARMDKLHGRAHSADDAVTQAA